jgi:hypothetical protein
MTASQAWVSIASRVQRRQVNQRRTWCFIESGQAFGGLKVLLDGPATSGDVDQFVQTDGV